MFFFWTGTMLNFGDIKLVLDMFIETFFKDDSGEY